MSKKEQQTVSIAESMVSKTIIEGKNIEVTEAIREYAETKLKRVHKHFDSIIKNHSIRVVLSVLKGGGDAKHRQKAEITINLTGGHVIRCEATEDTVYAALDLASDKIEKQFRKYKTRVYGKAQSGKSVKHFGIDELSPAMIPSELLESVADYKTPTIFKTKRFSMKPLDPEQAIGMLEDCGHQFYMFLNVFTNQVACIYRRDDGQYGLIEPELDL